MSDSTGQVADSAAEVYEQFFVPALFAEWADRVVERARIEPGRRALDVACGTGVLARAFAARIGAGNVTGLDCNPGMLSVAETRAPDIEWRRGVVEELPFDDGAFDAVASQFGLMFFEDRQRALREMWRVLRPGGRLVVAVWGSVEDTPGYAAMIALLRRLFGDSIADELRAPFCLGDERRLAGLFANAGISAEVETVIGAARFPSIAEWVHTEIRGWTLADRLSDAQFAQLSEEAGTELAHFAADDGAVRFESPAVIATARKHAA